MFSYIWHLIFLVFVSIKNATRTRRESQRTWDNECDDLVSLASSRVDIEVVTRDMLLTWVIKVLDYLAILILNTNSTALHRRRCFSIVEHNTLCRWALKLRQCRSTDKQTTRRTREDSRQSLLDWQDLASVQRLAWTRTLASSLRAHPSTLSMDSFSWVCWFVTGLWCWVGFQCAAPSQLRTRDPFCLGSVPRRSLCNNRRPDRNVESWQTLVLRTCSCWRWTRQEEDRDTTQLELSSSSSSQGVSIHCQTPTRLQPICSLWCPATCSPSRTWWW